MFLCICRTFLCRSSQRILGYFVKEQMGHACRLQAGRYPVIKSGLLCAASSCNDQSILSVRLCQTARLIHFSASELNIYRKIIGKRRIRLRFGCPFSALRDRNSRCRSALFFFLLLDFILVNNIYQSSKLFFIFHLTDDKKYNSKKRPSADHHPFLRHQGAPGIRDDIHSHHKT